MKFDPQAMKALLALDDRQLWNKIRAVAAGSGIALSENTPPPADMQRLRAALGGSGQADVAGALDTIARFRKARKS